MSKRKTWLEVALNGAWTRRFQPGIPISVGEIVADGIACVRAGAAIVHLHAYDAASGRQNDDADTYAAIIEGIKAEVDAIVYPTFPADGGGGTAAEVAGRRYAAVEALARRGLLDWTGVDPGSVNFASLHAIAADRPTSVYVNSETDIRHGLDLAARHRVPVSFACYEPGFVRLGAALHRRYPGAGPATYRLMFSSEFSFGFPPTPYALAAYCALLAEAAPGAPWMASGLGVDLRPLIPAVVAAGGHIRVGLEDAPLGTPIGNRGWTEAAAAAVIAAGGALAGAAEVRASLAESGRD